MLLSPVGGKVRPQLAGTVSPTNLCRHLLLCRMLRAGLLLARRHLLLPDQRYVHSCKCSRLSLSLHSRSPSFLSSSPPPPSHNSLSIPRACAQFAIVRVGSAIPCSRYSGMVTKCTGSCEYVSSVGICHLKGPLRLRCGMPGALLGRPSDACPVP